jgi:hypothetical protein
VISATGGFNISQLPGTFRIFRQPEYPKAASVSSSTLLTSSSLNNSPLHSVARKILNSFLATATITIFFIVPFVRPSPAYTKTASH